MFATRAEFGLFDNTDAVKHDKKNKIEALLLKKIIEKMLNFSTIPDVILNKATHHFLRNSAIPRIDHCNYYLYVYPQHAVFSDYDGVTPDKVSWEKYNIPMLVPNMKSSFDSIASSFTKSLTFNKEEANYRRESRFQTENLYTLAQLASVYNVTAETKPALDIFPGMLIWVNPGMYQSPSVRYSIVNILGMEVPYSRISYTY